MKHKPLLILSLAAAMLGSCANAPTHEAVKPFFSMDNLCELYRDTLANIDGSTYMLVSYVDTLNEKSRACIVEKRANDSVVHQVNVLPNEGRVLPDGHTLRLEHYAYHRDYDIRNLPAHLYFMPIDSVKGYVKKQVNFPSSGDSASRCVLAAHALLPEDAAGQTACLQRISDYLDIIQKGTPETFETLFGRFYQQRLEEWDDDFDTFAPEDRPMYSYDFEMLPLWVDSRSQLTTYYVAHDNYMGGAHGMPLDYYFTYAPGQRTPLGWADVFDSERFDKVFALISKKLADRWKTAYDTDVNDTDMWNDHAYIDDYDPNADGIIKAPNPSDPVEKIGDKYYPRPALCDRGVVFMYQVYVKDCFAAGPVVVVLTWDELKGCLKTGGYDFKPMDE